MEWTPVAIRRRRTSLEDERLPLLVFGPLALVRPAAEPVSVEGLSVPVPRSAGLILEKLVTDRTGEKGERDLLVAGLLMLSKPKDLEELTSVYQSLSAELRHTVRSNLTVLSLMRGRAQMPDPEPERARVAALLTRLDAAEKSAN